MSLEIVIKVIRKLLKNYMGNNFFEWYEIWIVIQTNTIE